MGGRVFDAILCCAVDRAAKGFDQIEDKVEPEIMLAKIISDSETVYDIPPLQVQTLEFFRSAN